eukprot:483642-Amphidinium_carterae.1
MHLESTNVEKNLLGRLASLPLDYNPAKPPSHILTVLVPHNSACVSAELVTCKEPWKQRNERPF